MSAAAYMREAPDRDPQPGRSGQAAIWFLLAAHCFLSPALAASPREDLLRLVPENVGFCLVLEDLRDHGKAVANSPFIQQFRTSPLGDKIRNAPETSKLLALDSFLQRYLELTSTQLREDIFGDALVLAYRPGRPGKSEDEQGLFLVRARDPVLLARLVERVNTLQKESGGLNDVEPCEYHGATYYRRSERAGANYYYLHGPVLAFAPREEILRQLIDRDREAPKDASSPVAEQFRQLGVNKCLAALWVNPRAFDAVLFEQALEQKAGLATDARAVALRTLAVYWKALEGMAFSVSLDKDLTLALAVRAKLDTLPPSAQRFLRAAAQPSDAWLHFPKNALLTLAGRVDVPAFTEMLSEFLADDAKKSVRSAIAGTVEAVLGKDTVQNLLASLGPDWGVCVVAPPASAAEWVPHVIGALRVARGSAGIPADLTVWNAVHALATLAVFHHNHGQPGPLHLKATLQSKIEVQYLANEEQLPPGVQPAFALQEGYLVVGSSPEAIGRFPASPSEALPPATRGVRLLTLSISGCCRYLTERRESVVSYAAAKNQITREEASKLLDHLLAVFQLFDRVELSQRSGPGLLTLTVRVQTAKPLR
jgi:hypothetical protein